MAPKTKQEQIVEDSNEITIDMSNAKTFSPLPEKRPFLVSVSKWKTGKSAKGALKIDTELTVVKPSDYANRKVPESISLENEWTKGRYQTMLIALGLNEADVKSNKHRVPKEQDILGEQLTIYVRTQSNDTYGERSRISRMLPASAYKEEAAL